MTENVKIRRASPEDAAICGPICYEAFAAIARQHNFPPDLPSPELATHLLGIMFSHPKMYCVVAEADGRIVGSNCLDERSIIAGIGPITVDPDIQNRRIGRALMDAILDRTRERRFAGVRLVQAAFHNRSMSLYKKLGFDAREPTRNARLLRWCLEQGLRIVYPMTLMTIGLYNEPAGAYMPSVSF